MEWKQQYTRYCRDCEYWEGIPNRSNRSKGFEGVKGTCHRWPPSCYHAETGQWVKPITFDSDGCGEFKLISYLHKDEVKSEDTQTSPQSSGFETREAELLTARHVAELLNVGYSHIYSMRSLGQLPLSIKLGASVRWNKRELLDWIQEGCPPLRKWEMLKKHRKY
jgi:predicted DNA-binding transcriptional regulator AlpA